MKSPPILRKCTQILEPRVTRLEPDFAVVAAVVVALVVVVVVESTNVRQAS
jgi:hypothetical protein